MSMSMSIANTESVFDRPPVQNHAAVLYLKTLLLDSPGVRLDGTAFLSNKEFKDGVLKPSIVNKNSRLITINLLGLNQFKTHAMAFDAVKSFHELFCVKTAALHDPDARFEGLHILLQQLQDYIMSHPTEFNQALYDCLDPNESGEEMRVLCDYVNHMFDDEHDMRKHCYGWLAEVQAAELAKKQQEIDGLKRQLEEALEQRAERECAEREPKRFSPGPSRSPDAVHDDLEV